MNFFSLPIALHWVAPGTFLEVDLETDSQMHIFFE